MNLHEHPEEFHEQIPVWYLVISFAVKIDNPYHFL